MHNPFLQSINILISFNVEKDHMNEDKIIDWTTYGQKYNRTKGNLGYITAYIKKKWFVMYVYECIYLRYNLSVN